MRQIHKAITLINCIHISRIISDSIDGITHFLSINFLELYFSFLILFYFWKCKLCKYLLFLSCNISSVFSSYFNSLFLLNLFLPGFLAKSALGLRWPFYDASFSFLLFPYGFRFYHFPFFLSTTNSSFNNIFCNFLLIFPTIPLNSWGKF